MSFSHSVLIPSSEESSDFVGLPEQATEEELDGDNVPVNCQDGFIADYIMHRLPGRVLYDYVEQMMFIFFRNYWEADIGDARMHQIIDREIQPEMLRKYEQEMERLSPEEKKQHCNRKAAILNLRNSGKRQNIIKCLRNFCQKKKTMHWDQGANYLVFDDGVYNIDTS